MDEKILIRGTVAKRNTLTTICCILGAWFFLCGVRAMVYDGFVYAADLLLVIMAIILFSVAIWHYFRTSRCEITVTTKRVYGRATFGKRVDLPIDMISTVAVKAFKGISVATASGRVTFYQCQNRDEVFESISRLLIERQEKKFYIHESAMGIAPESNADELKKFKSLLDDGVITQEEFDAKKKQLLGL